MHVLQEAQKQGLDLTPRAYEAKPRPKATQARAPRIQHVGLPAPVFILEGFWLVLANRRNHCYANSVLQILHWVVPSTNSQALQEAYRTSQLARIIPEHHALESVTRGWTFDGNQQDAAEFLSAILPNLSDTQVCCWETRSPMEAGYVVDSWSYRCSLHMKERANPDLASLQASSWCGPSGGGAHLRALPKLRPS